MIAAAVRDRQQLPRRPIELVVEQQRVRLDRDVVNAARTRARRSRKPHNEAKRIFHREAVRLLADQVRAEPGRAAGCSTPATWPTSATSSPRARQLTRELDELWPTLSAEQLLTDLFADPRRLNSVARRLPVGRPGAAGAARAGRRHPARAALDPGRRAAARRGRRAARRRRRRGRRPGGRGAARGGALRPGRAGRARPGGGPRPGAAARHRRRRRRPAGRAPAGAAATTPPPSGPPRTASGPTAT